MATATTEEGVHRLSDIVVEEVSGVDRAANKKRFLVVKRDEAPVGPAVTITPAGATAAVTTKKAGEQDVPPAVAPSGNAPGSTQAPGGTPAAATALAFTPDAKKASLTVVADSIEALMQVGQAIQDATEDANGLTTLPPEMITAITTATDNLTKLAASNTGTTPPPADPVTDPAPVNAAQATSGTAPAAKGENVTTPAAPGVPVIPAVGTPVPVAAAAIPAAPAAPVAPPVDPAVAVKAAEKAAAEKVAREKSLATDLQAHRNALGMVTTMLDTVLASSSETPKPAAAAPAAAPAAPAAAAPAKPVPPKPPTPPAAATPAPAAAKGEETELAKARDLIRKQEAEIIRLHKTVQPSNAARPGERGQAQKGAPSEAWPMDMAPPTGQSKRR